MDNREQSLKPVNVTRSNIALEKDYKSTLLKTSIEAATPLAVEIVSLEDYVQEGDVHVVMLM